MATKGKTTFTWLTVTEDDGAHEEYGTQNDTFMHPISVAPGTQLARLQAAYDLIGYGGMVSEGNSLLINGKPVAYISRRTPLRYPNIPMQGLPQGAPLAYCTQLKNGKNLGAGKLGTTGVTDSEQYRFDAIFESLLWDVREDTDVLAQHNAGADASPLYDLTSATALPDEADCLRRGIQYARNVTRHMRWNGKLLTIPPGFLVYSTAPNTSPRIGFPINEGAITVLYTWFNVPDAAYPSAAVQSMMNKVNNDTFDGWPQGTLLFQSEDVRPHKGPFGERLLTIQYLCKVVFSINLSSQIWGHNGFLRVFPDGHLDYDGVQAAAGTRLPFPSGPFSSLFRPNQPS